MKKKEYKKPSIIARRIHLPAIMTVSDITISDNPMAPEAKLFGGFDEDDDEDYEDEGNIFDQE